MGITEAGIVILCAIGAYLTMALKDKWVDSTGTNSELKIFFFIGCVIIFCMVQVFRSYGLGIELSAIYALLLIFMFDTQYVTDGSPVGFLTIKTLDVYPKFPPTQILSCIIVFVCIYVINIINHSRNKHKYRCDSWEDYRMKRHGYMTITLMA
jgi:hypothetical protein